MQIGYKLYEDLKDTNLEEFESLQLEMALTCEANGWCMEDGYDEDGRRYLIINPPVEYVPTEEEIQKALTNGVQKHMDKKAQERGYDNIHTACSYVNSTDEIFKAEGTACLAWRDQVWRKCYDILAEVKTGKRAVPTLEEVIAELPVLVW